MKMGMVKADTHNDQDSNISFKNDTDDETDTTEIEEEDWIDYIKRSTGEAIGKMDDAKIRCWIKTRISLRNLYQMRDGW